MDNLAALTSNQPGYVPVLVNGRPVKSINQYYNKRKAALQSQLGHPGTTKRMERMTNIRNRRIDHYLHTASRWIIDDLVAHGIGTLVIGKNDGWKQEANLGKRTNQNFVPIPHARFISMLTYKAERAGIHVIITEESYTSKASFLDRDEMPIYDPNQREKPKFSGKRIKRGLYRAAEGTRKARTLYLQANPEVTHYLLRDNQIVAAFTMVPLTPDAITAYREGRMNGLGAQAHQIRLFEPGERLACIIVNIMTTTRVTLDQRHRYAATQLRNFVKITLRGWAMRGVDIATVDARAGSEEGEHLLQQTGFQMLRSDEQEHAF